MSPGMRVPGFIVYIRVKNNITFGRDVKNK